MMTGSDGVSLRLPQLFFSQHRLSHNSTVCICESQSIDIYSNTNSLSYCRILTCCKRLQNTIISYMLSHTKYPYCC